MDKFTEDEQRLILHAAQKSLEDMDGFRELADYLEVDDEVLERITMKIGKVLR